MSWVASAIVGGAVVGGVASSYGAKKAGESAEQAAQTSAGAQMEQLAYLKEREALPQAYREQALQQLGSLYGLPGIQQPVQGIAPQALPAPTVATQPQILDPSLSAGNDMAPGGYMMDRFGLGVSAQTQPTMAGTGASVPDEVIAPAGYSPMSRGDFISGLRDDPLYAGMQEAGEEAILRGASATGGLRSGSANVNLARYNQDLMRSIYGERVAGLQGMAGLPSGAAQIGQTMANIGQTQAQGIQAQGQAWQQGMQGVSSAVGSGIGNYLWAQGKGLI